MNSLAKKLQDIEKEVSEGRGFVILRKLPLHLTDDPLDALTIKLGILCYLGNATPHAGYITAHVRRAMETRDPTNQQPKAHIRYAMRKDCLGYHTDIGGDILSLLCIRKAKEGGISSICSILAIHNELIRRGRVDVLKTLADPSWSWDVSHAHPKGESAFDESNKDEKCFQIPLFMYDKGYFSAIYTWLLENTPVTPEQAEALKVFEEIAQSDKFTFQFFLESGDCLFANNLTTMHGRSEFEDTAEEPRHLLRTWIEFDATKNRPLPEHMVFLRQKSSMLRKPSLEHELRSGSSKFFSF